MLRCQDHLFLAIGEVIDIIYQSKHIETIPLSKLTDSTSFIEYQLLILVPTTSDDDETMEYDWRWSLERGTTFKVQGRLVHPHNPTITTHTPAQPSYLFQSPILRTLGLSMLESLSTQDSALLPEVEPNNKFPYRYRGKACFVCEHDGKEREVAEAAREKCTHCRPPVLLPKKESQRVLEHYAAHILFDRNVDRELEPCGLCLRPAGVCVFFLRKGQNGVAVDWRKSTCANQLNFSYKVAAESTLTSPCSNVPISCPECNDPKAPAVWSYNMLTHLRKRHPHVDLLDFQDEFEISDFEQDMMSNLWKARHESKTRKRKPKKPTLVISESHSSRLAGLDIVPDKGEGVETDGNEGYSEPEDNEGEVPGRKRLRRANAVVTSEDESEEETGLAPTSPTDMGNETDEPAIHECTEPSNTFEASYLTETPYNPSTTSLHHDEHVTSPPEPIIDDSRPSRAKKRPRAWQIDDLSRCICGEPCDDAEKPVIECRNNGCETKTYHIACVGLARKTKNWLCEACQGSRRPRRKDGGRG